MSQNKTEVPKVYINEEVVKDLVDATLLREHSGHAAVRADAAEVRKKLRRWKQNTSSPSNQH